MKHIIRYSYFSFLFVLLAVSSCTKFLDQQPVSGGTDATIWKTDDDANSAVAACYSLTRSALDASVCLYAYGDLPTDIFSDVLDYDLLQIKNVNWSISVSSSATYDPKLKLRVYTPFYSAIQQSNRSLYFLKQMPSSAFTGTGSSDKTSRQNKYIGEVLFTRAFNYFYMARVWGDVPIDTTYEKDISTFKGLASWPQKEVLAAALADLNIAKQYLNRKDAGSTDRAVRADKGTVFTLMAHIYAWKGEYESCRMACDSVINSGTYSLVNGNDYSSIYAGQSAEGIFEIAQNTQTKAINANAYTASIANYTLSAPYLPNVTTPGWQISPTVLSGLYSDTGDLRYKQEFTSVISGVTRYYSCIKYSDIQPITTTNSGTYYILKNNLIIFRYADVLLLKAEALAAGPTPDYTSALALVNQVRDRAGIAEVTSVEGRDALINLVTAERGRELFLEGSRYYDLVRNEKLTGVSQFPNINQTDFLKGKYYWPLDPSLFVLNPLLTQTPFWAQLLTH